MHHHELECLRVREKNKTMAVIEKRERKVVCYQGQGHSDVSYIIKNMTDPFATRLSLMVQHYVKLKHLTKKLNCCVQISVIAKLHNVD